MGDDVISYFKANPDGKIEYTINFNRSVPVEDDWIPAISPVDAANEYFDWDTLDRVNIQANPSTINKTTTVVGVSGDIIVSNIPPNSKVRVDGSVWHDVNDGVATMQAFPAAGEYVIEVESGIAYHLKSFTVTAQ